MDSLIATKLNDGLKHCAGTFAKSATECSNPELRRLLAQASQNAIQTQEKLTTLMQQRGWYRPPAARQEDIQMIVPQLQALTAETTVTV